MDFSNALKRSPNKRLSSFQQRQKNSVSTKRFAQNQKNLFSKVDLKKINKIFIIARTAKTFLFETNFARNQKKFDFLKVDLQENRPTFICTKKIFNLNATSLNLQYVVFKEQLDFTGGRR